MLNEAFFALLVLQVDENMKRSQKRDAVLDQKFHFRTNITTTMKDHKDPVVQEMTIDQIINGDESLDYPGLLPLVILVNFNLQNAW